jgi:hypothetical protein
VLARHEALLDLTRIRSATAGGSQCSGGRRDLSHRKLCRTPASGWLHHMVRWRFACLEPPEHNRRDREASVAP